MKKLTTILFSLLLLSACNNQGDFAGNSWGDQEKDVIDVVEKNNNSEHFKEVIVDDITGAEYTQLTYADSSFLGYEAEIDYLLYTQLEPKFLGNSNRSRNDDEIWHFEEPVLLEINIFFDNGIYDENSEFNKDDLYSKLTDLYGTPVENELFPESLRWHTKRYEVYYNGDDYISFIADEELAKNFVD